MIRIALLAFSISSAQAHSHTDTVDLPQALKNLHVNIPASCSVIEKPIANPPGSIPAEKCTASTFSTTTKVEAKVYRIVDGDTIHVYVGAKIYGIRMLGVDTPELHFFSRAQPRWGQIAKNTLDTMLKANDPVTLEFDKVKCDKYGRILVHVFRKGVNIGFEQVRNGMAANYCIAPNLKHCDAYGDAYNEAKSYQRGIHSDKCSVTAYVWRKAMQGLPMDKKVKDRRTGKIYTPADYYKIPVADRVFLPAGTDEMQVIDF